MDVNCLPAISEPSDKSSYIQYVTTSNNEFTLPAFEGSYKGNINITYTLTGTNASSLAIAKSDNDWIITPTSTSTDDVTYYFDINATDGCNEYSSANSSFILHVGCPAAAGADTFTFVDNAPSSTSLLPNSLATSVVNVNY